MRKPLLLTLVCLLLLYGFDDAGAQTMRRRTAGRRVGAATLKPVHQLIDVGEKQLLGSFNGRIWLDALKTMPLVKEGETFRLYSLKGPSGTVVIGKPVPPEYPCDDIVEVPLSPEPEGEEDIIGVNGSWNAQPRLPKVMSTGQEEYRKVVGDFLRRAGLRNPRVTILQLLRVDLEGDGAEEVLISSNSAAEPGMFMGKGDFSVVLLRRIIRGAPQTIPINSEVELKNHEDPVQTAQWHHKETVAGVLDVDGDGRMEVITTFRSFRDNGKSVYELSGRKPRQVLGWYCSGGH